MSGASAPWFEQGLRFSCQAGCVRCCCGAPGDVFITDEECRRLAALLHLSVAEFDGLYVRHYSSGKQSLSERANGDCVLLDGKGCGSYAVRPQQCRAYPFWPEVVKNREAWLREARRCPGIGAGELYSAEEILALVKSQTEGSLPLMARKAVKGH